MATVLYVNASLGGDASHSKRLAGEFLQAWQARHPEDVVVRRDLAANPPPLVNEAFVRAIRKPYEEHTADEAAIIKVSDELVDEIMGADYVVLAAPVYNFTLPTGLKAYLDLLVRVGRTMLPGPQGSVGQLTGKKVLVISARLGDYSPGSGREHFDHHEPYLRFLLGRLGMTDVTYVAASQNPGLHDEETRAAQMAAYVARVRAVVDDWSEALAPS